MDSEATINFYDEFGLDRDASVSEIRSKLKDLKIQLQAKAVRPGSQQERFRHQLDAMPLAEAAFADEDARDQYDARLRRQGKPAAGEAQPVDWTMRAWNYYFVGDTGAATVAARKAKEQTPNEAMPFVVSAWVKLREASTRNGRADETEVKQAKQDADEAFVLDQESTADSVDVQMVRGTVYFLLDDYDRALTSFDRAMKKASDREQAEIHWRKALVYGGMNRWSDSYQSGMKGLSQGIDIGDDLQRNLEGVTSNAVNNLCEQNQPQESAKRYAARRSEVASSQIYQSSKKRIDANIGQNLDRCNNHAKLLAEQTRLKAFREPEGSRPEIPGFAIGAAIVAFIIMVSVFAASPTAGVIFLLIDASQVALVVRGFKKRTEWDQNTASFVDAQRRLKGVVEKLNVSPSLSRPIFLKD